MSRGASGLVLDPVYCGKAMHGLKAAVERGDVARGVARPVPSYWRASRTARAGRHLRRGARVKSADVAVSALRPRTPTRRRRSATRRRSCSGASCSGAASSSRPRRSRENATGDGRWCRPRSRSGAPAAWGSRGAIRARARADVGAPSGDERRSARRSAFGCAGARGVGRAWPCRSAAVVAAAQPALGAVARRARHRCAGGGARRAAPSRGRAAARRGCLPVGAALVACGLAAAAARLGPRRPASRGAGVPEALRGRRVGRALGARSRSLDGLRGERRVDLDDGAGPRRQLARRPLRGRRARRRRRVDPGVFSRWRRWLASALGVESRFRASGGGPRESPGLDARPGARGLPLSPLSRQRAPSGQPDPRGEGGPRAGADDAAPRREGAGSPRRRLLSSRALPARHPDLRGARRRSSPPTSRSRSTSRSATSRPASPSRRAASFATRCRSTRSTSAPGVISASHCRSSASSSKRRSPSRRAGRPTMARRVTEFRRSLAPPAPDSSPPEMRAGASRDMADTAFSELDAGELRFALAEPAPRRQATGSGTRSSSAGARRASPRRRALSRRRCHRPGWANSSPSRTSGRSLRPRSPCRCRHSLGSPTRWRCRWSSLQSVQPPRRRRNGTCRRPSWRRRAMRRSCGTRRASFSCAPATTRGERSRRRLDALRVVAGAGRRPGFFTGERETPKRHEVLGGLGSPLVAHAGRRAARPGRTGGPPSSRSSRSQTISPSFAKICSSGSSSSFSTRTGASPSSTGGRRRRRGAVVQLRGRGTFVVEVPGELASLPSRAGAALARPPRMDRRLVRATGDARASVDRVASGAIGARSVSPAKGPSSCASDERAARRLASGRAPVANP